MDANMSVRTGTKNDTQKVDLTLIDPRFLSAMARVLEAGNKQYGFQNWKGLDPQRLRKALYRHLLAELAGESTDGDSGELHVVHIACGCMMLGWLKSHGKDELNDLWRELGPTPEPEPAMLKPTDGAVVAIASNERDAHWLVGKN